MISRRKILLGGAVAAASSGVASLSNVALAQLASVTKLEIVKSDEEWRHELTAEQYAEHVARLVAFVGPDTVAMWRDVGALGEGT